MLFNTISVYLLRVFSGFGILLTLLVIGRFYGVDEVAEFALFLLFFNLAIAISVWGGNVSVIDECNKFGGYGVLGSILIGKLLDSLLVVFVFYCILSVFGYWSYGIFAIIPVSLGVIFSSFLIAKSKPLMAAIFNEFGRALLPLVVVLLAVFVWGGVEFSLLISISYASLFLIVPMLLGYFYINNVSVSVKGFSFDAWARGKKENFPILLPQVLFVIVAQADRLIIEFFGSSYELASYFSAQSMYAVVVFAVQAVFIVVTPKVSRVALHGRGSIKKEGRFVCLFSILISLAVIPVAYVYYGLMAVDVYLSMAILLLLLFGNMISSFFGIGFQTMQFFLLKSPYLKVTLICMVGQFVFIMLFYRVLGVFAVALGFAFYTISSSIMACFFWKKIGVSVLPFSSDASKDLEILVK